MLEVDKAVKEMQGIRADSVPPEVLTSTQPLLLKGLVADWPFVKAGRRSMSAAAQYLLKFYANTHWRRLRPAGKFGSIFL